MIARAPLSTPSARLTARGANALLRRFEDRDPPPAVVIVAGSDAFHRRHGGRGGDVALIALYDGDIPAAVRWPALPDTVTAIVEDTRPNALRSLVNMLFIAGAEVVEVLAEIGDTLRAGATFTRGMR